MPAVASPGWVRVRVQPVPALRVRRATYILQQSGRQLMSLGRDGSRGVRRFVPRVENLEDRTVPAGNVTVSVAGGMLYVGGDDAANQILISGAGSHSVTVQALDATTTINGRS